MVFFLYKKRKNINFLFFLRLFNLLLNVNLNVINYSTVILLKKILN